ncbi:MAG: BON domain-containing protein, partial [Thermomicrobiales bacterium]
LAVTLTGEVESSAIRQAALDVAQATVGRAGCAVVDAIVVLDMVPELRSDEGRDGHWYESFGTFGTLGALPDDGPAPANLAGSTDAMVAADEGVPWFPPTDPVVGPTNDARGLEMLNGFAGTADEHEPEEEASAARDGDLAERVMRALADDAATSDLPINAEAFRGVVYLRGEVPTLDDAENAEAVAAEVSGVSEVRETLRVTAVRERR